MPNPVNGAAAGATVEGAGAVRQGEEFDAAAVTAYLVAQGLTVEGEPQVSQFAGGASNLTYLLRYSHQDVIVRRRRTARPGARPPP